MRLIVATGTSPDVCSWIERVDDTFQLTKTSALQWAMKTCFDDEDGSLYAEGYEIEVGVGGEYLITPRGYEEFGVVVLLIEE